MYVHFRGAFRGEGKGRAPPLDFENLKRKITTAIDKETKRKMEKEEIYCFWIYDGHGTPPS